MKLRTEDILELLKEWRHIIPIESRWAHYKGGTYQVVGYGLDTERGLINVAYRRIGGPNFHPVLEAQIIFHRPASDWNGDRFKEIAR